MVQVRTDNNFSGVYWITENGQERIATLNLVPGKKVYGEKVIQSRDIEYRLWDPFRSKLAAAIINGLNFFPFKDGARVLYLGASTGTTVSHVSDIVKDNGIVFAVEFSPRVANEFIDRCAKFRKNIITIVEDARKPENYVGIFGKVDVVYCDIAQPDQTEIAIKNCKMFLRKDGILMLIVKSRSIDVVKEPTKIFEEEEKKLKSSGFEVLQKIELSPFDKDHALIVSKKLF
ncbi:MAG: fibrillarin-like rRNA/tRNA 2'-O-methyltransferase [Nitrososphaeria archaeon]|nr:fibrillarin-like rRNA/tRNA 2'-O-methyltransferase [Nitrososphaeria archaeon]